MFDTLVRKLLAEDRLRRQAVGKVQVTRLIAEASLDIEEARKLVALSPRAVYLFAYTAMLKAARGLLLLHGLRPDDGNQHRTVTELVAALLGREHEKATAYFDTMRRKRNDMTYEAGALVSPTEAEKALSCAESLFAAVRAAAGVK